MKKKFVQWFFSISAILSFVVDTVAFLGLFGVKIFFMPVFAEKPISPNIIINFPAKIETITFVVWLYMFVVSIMLVSSKNRKFFPFELEKRKNLEPSSFDVARGRDKFKYPEHRFWTTSSASEIRRYKINSLIDNFLFGLTPILLAVWLAGFGHITMKVYSFLLPVFVLSCVMYLLFSYLGGLKPFALIWILYGPLVIFYQDSINPNLFSSIMLSIAGYILAYVITFFIICISMIGRNRDLKLY